MADTIPTTDLNKNPGNLTDADTGKFKKFATWAEGFEAQAHQLRRDYFVHKLKTPRQIINARKWGWANEWAPGNTHASAAGYVKYLASKLGIGPDDDLGFSDRKRLAAFMVHQYEVESGHRPAETTTVQHVLTGTLQAVNDRRFYRPGAPARRRHI